MKRSYLLPAAAGITALLLGVSLFPVRPPAFAASRQWAATPDNANPATPSDIIYDEDELFLSYLSDDQASVYTLCGYELYIWPNPLVLELGDEFDAADVLPEEIDVYLDGPNGHMEDPVSLNVTWDLSGVDFDAEGEYPVTGTLDTNSCQYPVDWDLAPAPSFLIRIARGGTLSFQTSTDGDTLTLAYEMNGEPLKLSNPKFDLYESTDNGANWHNLTESRRLQVNDRQLAISGITQDCLFQMIELHTLGDYYSTCSDIVAVTVADGSLSAQIMESGGIQGGDIQGGGNWDSTPILDGSPYRILKYTTANRWMPRPLDLSVVKGEPPSQQYLEYFNEIYVYYGVENSFWEEKIQLPVQWDWDSVNPIDWNTEGQILVPGTFSSETVEDLAGLLDFSDMPELVLTISIAPQRTPFALEAEEERLFEDSTARFLFYDDLYAPLSFEDLSCLTVWCSTDGGDNWYDITAAPNVTLRGDGLAVSHLKNTVLRGLGYTFQIEQKKLTDYESFSSYMTVTHDTLFGIYFEAATGGDRGGGNRYPKPPEGLFDPDGSDTPSESEPETTEPSATEPSTTEPSATEPSTTEPSTTEPSTTEPSTTEPSTTEPSTTEPSTTETPAESGPSGSGSSGNSSGGSSGSSSGGSGSGGPAETTIGGGSTEAPADTFAAEAEPSEQRMSPQDAALIPNLKSASGKLSPEEPAPDRNERGGAAAGEAEPDGSAAAGEAERGGAAAEPAPGAPTPTESTPTESALTESALETASPARGIPLRAVIGIAMLLAGGAAGIWMIRRR